MARTDTSNFFTRLNANSFGHWAIFPRYCWQEAESCVKRPCRAPLSLLLPASNNAGSVFYHPCLPALLFIFKTCLWLWCFFSGKFGLGSTSLTHLLIWKCRLLTPWVQGGRGKMKPWVKSDFKFCLSSWTVGFALNWAGGGWDLELIYLTK